MVTANLTEAGDATTSSAWSGVNAIRSVASAWSTPRTTRPAATTTGGPASVTASRSTRSPGRMSEVIAGDPRGTGTPTSPSGTASREPSAGSVAGYGSSASGGAGGRADGCPAVGARSAPGSPSKGDRMEPCQAAAAAADNRSGAATGSAPPAPDRSARPGWLSCAGNVDRANRRRKPAPAGLWTATGRAATAGGRGPGRHATDPGTANPAGSAGHHRPGRPTMRY